jgi:hypothetical protein
MQDCELYGRIMGTSASWRVERVERELDQGEVHVYLAHEDKRAWPCAECAARQGGATVLKRRFENVNTYFAIRLQRA